MSWSRVLIASVLLCASSVAWTSENETQHEVNFNGTSTIGEPFVPQKKVYFQDYEDFMEWIRQGDYLNVLEKSGITEQILEDILGRVAKRAPIEPMFPIKYISSEKVPANYKNPITILSSKRPGHLFLSYLLQRNLEKYLGYKVTVVEKNEMSSLENVVKDFTDCYNFSDCKVNDTAPEGKVNLEVWLGANHSLTECANKYFIQDLGPLGPIGRHGVFFYSKDKDVSSDCMMEFWRDYRNISCVKQFDLLNGNFPGVDPDKIEKFIPDWCNDTKIIKCADMVMKSSEALPWLEKLVKNLRLMVNVFVLEDKFSDFVKDKIRQKLNVLFFTSQPDIFTVPTEDVHSVSFPRCFEMSQSSGLHNFCFFEMQQMRKIIWPNLQVRARDAVHLIKNFHFNQTEYNNILERYRFWQDSLETPEKITERIVMENNYWNMKIANWLPETHTKKTFFIGGIFPSDGPEWNDKGIEIAAKLACQHLGKDILTNGVELISKSGNCETVDVITSLVDFSSDKEKQPFLIGILGPGCTNTVEPAAIIAKYYKLTLMSYSAEGPLFTFSDNEMEPESKYSEIIKEHFFRTTPENTQYLYAYCELFKKMGWKKAGFLIEEDPKLSGMYAWVEKLFKSKCGVTNVVKESFVLNAKRSDIEKKLQNLKNRKARVILGGFKESAAKVIFCHAYHLGMYYDNSVNSFQWIIPWWFRPGWFLESVKDANNTPSCSKEQMKLAVSGHMTSEFRWFADGQDELPKIGSLEKWQNKYKALCEANKVNTSNYAGFAFDAVWAFGLAFSQLIEENEGLTATWPNDKDLMKFHKILMNLTFQGVSGNVSFSGKTRLVPIDLYLWNETIGRRLVGNYTPLAIDGGDIHVSTFLMNWIKRNNIFPEADVEIPYYQECYFPWLAKSLKTDCQKATLTLILTTSFGIFIVVLIILVYLVKRRYESRIQETEDRMRELGLNPGSSILALDQWEIPRENIVINRILGEGAFGTVYGGETKLDNKGWVAVAVKTLKIGGTPEEKLDFLSEAEIMKRFDHKNIIQLIGVCTVGQPVYMVMEFMLYGDLKTYLLSRRNLVYDKNRDDNDEVSDRRLTNMALDVARGLCYLTSLKYLHRDLACRNCLVNSFRTVKIGDFGMCRAMYDNDYYRFRKKGMLPIRWMAPESLSDGIFTHKTDVWSYGILLFELVTFGSVPYGGLSNSQVIEYLKDHKSLRPPEKCKKELKHLLQHCWDHDSEKRPTAFEIMEVLANHSELLTPCLDAPITSVDFDDQIVLKSRKSSLKKISATISPLRRKSAGNELLEEDRNKIVMAELARLNLSRRGPKSKTKPFYQNLQPRRDNVYTLEPYSITSHL